MKKCKLKFIFRKYSLFSFNKKHNHHTFILILIFADPKAFYYSNEMIFYSILNYVEVIGFAVVKLKEYPHVFKKALFCGATHRSTL